MKEEKRNKAEEPQIQYGPRFYNSQEEQEMIRLKEALARTDDEKFQFLMKLMKLQKTLSKAKLKRLDGSI